MFSSIHEWRRSHRGGKIPSRYLIKIVKDVRYEQHHCDKVYGETIWAKWHTHLHPQIIVLVVCVGVFGFACPGIVADNFAFDDGHFSLGAFAVVPGFYFTPNL